MYKTTDNKTTKFRLKGLTLRPGERISGELELGEGRFLLPASVIQGAGEGKTVLITAGIHAEEYVGIQAAMELAEGLNPERICGRVIIVKVVNRPSFELRAGSMGHEDGKNLNREFPGDPQGTETQQLAWAIAGELHREADYYIDLHSGDGFEQLAPYVYYAGKADPEVVEISRKMAEQVDVPYMVRSTVATGGSYNYAAAQGVPGILIERGGMGCWTSEEVQSTKRDVRNILCCLGIYRGQRDYRQYYPLDVSDITYQAAVHTGCWYPRKEPGDLIRGGEELGVVKDYEGNVLEVCRAEYEGVILYQTGSLQVVADGPMIAYGKIVRRHDDRKERITEYWTKRSDSFLEQRRAELDSPLARRWMERIREQLPQKEKLKILDVGCGSGFFSILLAREGHEVIGTDLTPEMVVNSRKLAREQQADCKFLVMDAEALDFEDETFDVIISRNLTWTLPDAEKAYTQWCRVLKTGGILLNFDANYGASDFSDTSELPENHAHHEVGDDMMRECEEIKRQLPISTYMRPAWDLEILGRIGMERFQIDLGISRKVYLEKDAFYNPTPMFMICAVKGNNI